MKHFPQGYLNIQESHLRNIVSNIRMKTDKLMDLVQLYI